MEPLLITRCGPKMKLELSWLHLLWIGVGAAGGLYWLSQLRA
jgi:hypothetical protein